MPIVLRSGRKTGNGNGSSEDHGENFSQAQETIDDSQLTSRRSNDAGLNERAHLMGSIGNESAESLKSSAAEDQVIGHRDLDGSNQSQPTGAQLMNVTSNSTAATENLSTPSVAPSTATPHSNGSTSQVSARFSVRVATCNVCIFPLATRNQWAVLQLVVALMTGFIGWMWIMGMYVSFLPLFVRLLLVPLLTLLSVMWIIPLEGGLMWLLSRGRWHDFKRDRLRLLIQRLDALDIVCLQEMFCGIYDARHRRWLIQRAKERGFNYVVAPHERPFLPALLINQGTLILSRYPIVDSASYTFQHTAFFDRWIVNRGALWAKVRLPAPTSASEETLHVFTCHLAPPLDEVVHRTGSWMKRWTECVQLKQMKELMTFMKEKIGQDKCHSEVESGGPANSNISSSVVLAGDFNLDCGSERYWWLAHHLQGIRHSMHDLFAQEEGIETSMNCLTPQPISTSDNMDGCPCASLPATDQPTILTSPSPPSSPLTGYTSPNEWTWDHGHGRIGGMLNEIDHDTIDEPASNMANDEDNASTKEEEGGSKRDQGMLDHRHFIPVRMKNKKLKWEATFGQKILHHHQQQHSNSPLSPSDSSPSPSSDPSSTTASATMNTNLCSHLESFLTHPSLLGSHTTHDFMFCSIPDSAVLHRCVDPMFARHMKKRWMRHMRNNNNNNNNTMSANQNGNGGAAHAVKLVEQADNTSSSSDPPYTQLSDHSALIATLLLPADDRDVASQ